MNNGRSNKKKRGFTLMELIVVMSIIGILALLAAPSFIGKTEEANRTKHFANVRVLEDAAERYFIDHGKWPRGEEEPYTPEEVTAYAERIFDITGRRGCPRGRALLEYRLRGIAAFMPSFLAKTTGRIMFYGTQLAKSIIWTD